MRYKRADAAGHSLQCAVSVQGSGGGPMQGARLQCGAPVAYAMLAFACLLAAAFQSVLNSHRRKFGLEAQVLHFNLTLFSEAFPLHTGGSLHELGKFLSQLVPSHVLPIQLTESQTCTT